jgi:hypothetical protein
MWKHSLPLAAFLWALSAASCALREPETGAARGTSLNTRLTGEEEVPPVETAGSSAAAITYDTASRLLPWEIAYEGLSSEAMAAHIHGPGAMGEAGAPVRIPLGG